MSALCDRVAALLADPADALRARSIRGSDDPGAIAARVVRLDDGARAVLKAHTLGERRLRAFDSLATLGAVYAAQVGAPAGLYPRRTTRCSISTRRGASGSTRAPAPRAPCSTRSPSAAP